MSFSHILARLNAATELPTLEGVQVALGRNCAETLKQTELVPNPQVISLLTLGTLGFCAVL